MKIVKFDNRNLAALAVQFLLQLTKAAMLPLTGFICLPVAYREAFSEELSRLI